MIDEQKLLDQARGLGFSEEAIAVIEQIRSSDPSRRVRSGAGNMTGRYPSRKMGVTISFESHKVEAPIIHEFEHDDGIDEYYDQPPPIKLEYYGPDGKRRSHLHTPDFFVFGRDGAGWQECKTEEQLLKLEAQNRNRYCRDEDGEWRSPAGEAYASKFGFYYSVRCSKKIDWTFQRNISFLEDYYRADAPVILETTRSAILEVIAAEPGIKLTDLFCRTESFATRDDIYFLIAGDSAYVNLYTAPLVEPERVQVFPNKQSAIAHGLIIEISGNTQSSRPRFVELAVGNSIHWNGNVFRILNAGNGQVSLLDAAQKFVELPQAAFEALIKEGKVTGLADAEQSTVHPFVSEALAGASEEDLAIANSRCAVVRPFVGGETLPDDIVFAGRTLRRYAKSYRECDERYGCGYVGLLPKIRRRGYRGSKLQQATRDKVEHFIENDYETLKQKRMYEVWAVLVKACIKDKLIPPSYKTFSKAVRRSERYKQIRKRKGGRAAYAHEPFFWRLNQETPRHGDRPFEIAHIDHTELDVELLNSETGRSMGRCWLSIMIDAYSRKFLAVYLTFDPPSYRSCMMLLRECIRRHGRFPQTIVVDGGSEFQSTYFETLLARYECTKKVRPPAKPRFGSICERLFNTTNTQFIHNLRGNTQITKEVRVVTKSVNPKGQATWSLKELYQRVCEYAYEVYDQLDHRTLGQSPREAFAAGLLRTGHRNHRFIPYDESFRMATLPSTPKGTAKVTPGRGVKIHNLFYWSDAFRSPLVENKQVKVRYDPFKVGLAYAFVGNQWVECHSEYFSVFAGKSEKELMFATKELRARLRQSTEQFTITAKKIAEFLQSLEGEETLLLQRQRDRESQSVLESMGVAPQDNGFAGRAAPADVADDSDGSESEESDEAKEFIPETYGEFE